MKVTNVDVWKLGRWEDEREGFEIIVEVYFELSEPVTINYEGTEQQATKIAMVSDWGNHIVLRLANDDKTFWRADMSKNLINCVLDVLDEEQSVGGELEGWEFRYDIIEMLV